MLLCSADPHAFAFWQGSHWMFATVGLLAFASQAEGAQEAASPQPFY
jgi:hypothetical protein